MTQTFICIQLKKSYKQNHLYLFFLHQQSIIKYMLVQVAQKLSVFTNGICFLSFDGEILNLSFTVLDNGKSYSRMINQNAIKPENGYQYSAVTPTLSSLIKGLQKNEKMRITNDDDLIVPIVQIINQQIIYNQIKLKLYQNHIPNPTNYYLNTLLKLKKHWPSQCQKYITFKGDPTNPKYTSFVILQQGKMIKMLANNLETIFNHNQSIKQGIVVIRIKIKTTISKHIFLGICSDKIKGQINANSNPQFIGFLISNGNVYANGLNKNIVTPQLVHPQPSYIYSMKINLNCNILEWEVNGFHIGCWKINENLLKGQIYPFVNLYSKDDIIEFL